MSDLDHRLNAYRDDLADSRLRDRVVAARFVDGTTMRVTAAIAALRRRPADDAPSDSELLYGEEVRVFEQVGDWAWCQLATDGYVGFAPVSALAADRPAPTHRVAALRTFLYPEPELRRTPLAALSIGSRVTVVGRKTVRDLDYAVLADGSAVVARHLAADGVPADDDYVAVAEQFLGTPYLWAGRSSIGLDCSALVQIAMMMTGPCPLRDSDMQEATIGTPLEYEQGLPALARGDLVFWRGHVGIMADEETLLHASGHRMAVVKDRLAEVVARLDGRGLPVSSVRRPTPASLTTD